MNYLMQIWDQHPVIALVAFLFICYLIGRKRRQAAHEPEYTVPTPSSGPAPSYTAAPSYAPAGGGLLSQPLFHWSSRDVFRIGDLLRSVAIFGASGSGKTSGSGYVLAKALAKTKKVGGLILASKPEDREFWSKIFHNAGRQGDLITFNPRMPWRMNFIDFIRKNGGDTRDVTEALMVIGETLEQGDGGNRDPFWKEQNRRMIHNAVEIVMRAKGNVTVYWFSENRNFAFESLAGVKGLRHSLMIVSVYGLAV